MTLSGSTPNEAKVAHSTEPFKRARSAAGLKGGHELAEIKEVGKPIAETSADMAGGHVTASKHSTNES
jgi:hypothetical protein